MDGDGENSAWHADLEDVRGAIEDSLLLKRQEVKLFLESESTIAQAILESSDYCHMCHDCSMDELESVHPLLSDTASEESGEDALYDLDDSTSASMDMLESSDHRNICYECSRDESDVDTLIADE